MWGHEHDCISEAKPIPVAGRPYYISQPGSSIATSLSKGESIPKYVHVPALRFMKHARMDSTYARARPPSAGTSG